jgi:hypothetical protein
VQTRSRFVLACELEPLVKTYSDSEM